jgi:transposase InsO family protein
MLKITRKRTRPYTPRTNGKSERFVQTFLREWAYAKPYKHVSEQAAALLPFPHNRCAPRPGRYLSKRASASAESTPPVMAMRAKGAACATLRLVSMI